MRVGRQRDKDGSSVVQPRKTAHAARGVSVAAPCARRQRTSYASELLVIRFVLFSRVTKGPTAPRKGDNHARVRSRERGRRGRIRRVTANVARLRLGTRRLCGAVCGAPRYEIADVYARARALSLSLPQPRRSNRARGRDCQFYVQLIGTLRVGSNGVTAAVVDVDIA